MGGSRDLWDWDLWDLWGWDLWDLWHFLEMSDWMDVYEMAMKRETSLPFDSVDDLVGDLVGDLACFSSYTFVGIWPFLS
jgi:hypothetical protein